MGWNTLSGSEEGRSVWNFDDGLGNDLSGGGNHAALHGDAVLLEADVVDLGGVLLWSNRIARGFFAFEYSTRKQLRVDGVPDVNGNQAQDVGEPSGVFAGSR